MVEIYQNRSFSWTVNKMGSEVEKIVGRGVRDLVSGSLSCRKIPKSLGSGLGLDRLILLKLIPYCEGWVGEKILIPVH